MSDERNGSIAGSNSALAPLHNAWLGMLTGLHNPASEPKATCGDCVMCAGIERSGSQVHFSDAKCCTYVPHLANFLAGKSLQGPGRATVVARIAGAAGVTPLGMGLSYADIARVVGARSHFGRSDVVVCPHFDHQTKGCAIWQSRNAVCSTWFCKYERGAVSQRFWHAVRDLLIAAEERMAYRCLTRGALPHDQVQAVLAHRADVRAIIARANAGETIAELDTPDEAAGWYEQMWGDWAGRETDWFENCADFVGDLGPDELRAGLDDLGDLAASVRDRFEDLSTREISDRLTFSPGAGSEATADVLRLVGYSEFDPLILPAPLLADLQRLDGRPIRQVRNGIDPPGTPLNDNLLLLLQDFGVALPAQTR